MPDWEHKWGSSPQVAGNTARCMADLKMLAATQQPWIAAMELPWNSEPGLADIPVLVKKTEIHILKWNL